MRFTLLLFLFISSSVLCFSQDTIPPKKVQPTISDVLFNYSKKCNGAFNWIAKTKFKTIINKYEKEILKSVSKSKKIQNIHSTASVDIYDCPSKSIMDNNNAVQNIYDGKGSAVLKNGSVLSGIFKQNQLYKGIALTINESCSELYLGYFDSLRFYGNGLLFTSDFKLSKGYFEYDKLKNGCIYSFNNKGQLLDSVIINDFNKPTTVIVDSAIEISEKKVATPGKYLTYKSMDNRCDSLTDAFSNPMIHLRFLGYVNYILVEQDKDYLLKRRDPEKENISFYSGEYKYSNVSKTDSLPHGNGLWLLANGNKYHGKFVSGKLISGWKYEKHPDCNYQIVCEVKYGKLNGTGFEIHYNGEWYFGLYKDDKIYNGEGYKINPETNQLQRFKFSNKFYHYKPD